MDKKTDKVMAALKGRRQQEQKKVPGSEGSFNPVHVSKKGEEDLGSPNQYAHRVSEAMAPPQIIGGKRRPVKTYQASTKGGKGLVTRYRARAAGAAGGDHRDVTAADRVEGAVEAERQIPSGADVGDASGGGVVVRIDEGHLDAVGVSDVNSSAVGAHREPVGTVDRGVDGLDDVVVGGARRVGVDHRHRVGARVGDVRLGAVGQDHVLHRLVADVDGLGDEARRVDHRDGVAAAVDHVGRSVRAERDVVRG